jgi:hypothetical protein
MTGMAHSKTVDFEPVVQKRKQKESAGILIIESEDFDHGVYGAKWMHF